MKSILFRVVISWLCISAFVEAGAQTSELNCYFRYKAAGLRYFHAEDFDNADLQFKAAAKCDDCVNARIAEIDSLLELNQQLRLQQLQKLLDAAQTSERKAREALALAQARTREVLANDLASKSSTALQNGDPVVALRLAEYSRFFNTNPNQASSALADAAFLNNTPPYTYFYQTLSTSVPVDLAEAVLSPNEEILAVASNSGKVQLFDVKNNVPTLLGQCPLTNLVTIHFLSNTTLKAISHEGKYAIWNISKNSWSKTQNLYTGAKPELGKETKLTSTPRQAGNSRIRFLKQDEKSNTTLLLYEDNSLVLVSKDGLCTAYTLDSLSQIPLSVHALTGSTNVLVQHLSGWVIADLEKNGKPVDAGLSIQVDKLAVSSEGDYVSVLGVWEDDEAAILFQHDPLTTQLKPVLIIRDEQILDAQLVQQGVNRFWVLVYPDVVEIRDAVTGHIIHRFSQHAVKGQLVKAIPVQNKGWLVLSDEKLQIWYNEAPKPEIPYRKMIGTPTQIIPTSAGLYTNTVNDHISILNAGDGQLTHRVSLQYGQAQVQKLVTDTRRTLLGARISPYGRKHNLLELYKASSGTYINTLKADSIPFFSEVLLLPASNRVAYISEEGDIEWHSLIDNRFLQYTNDIPITLRTLLKASASQSEKRMAMLFPNELVMMELQQDEKTTFYDQSTRRFKSGGFVDAAGTRFALVSEDGHCELYDVEKGISVYTQQLNGVTPRQVYTAPNKPIAIFSEEGELILLDTNLTTLHRIPKQQTIISAEFEGESDLLFALDDTQQLHTINVKTGKVKTQKLEHASGVNTFWALPGAEDGSHIHIEGNTIVLPNGERIKQLYQSKGLSHNNAKHLVRIQDDTLLLYQLNSNKPIGRLSPYQNWKGVYVSQTDDALVAWTNDSVFVWTNNNYNTPTALKDHRAGVVQAAISPDGKRMATASNDRTIRIYQLNPVQLLQVLEGQQGSITSLDFSPNNLHQLVSVSDNNQVVVWDVLRGNPLFTLQTGLRLIGNAAYSLQGDYLMLADIHNTVQIWDAKAGKFLMQIKLPVQGISHVFWEGDENLVVSTPNFEVLRFSVSCNSFIQHPLAGELNDRQLSKYALAEAYQTAPEALKRILESANTPELHAHALYFLELARQNLQFKESSYWYEQCIPAYQKLVFTENSKVYTQELALAYREYAFRLLLEGKYAQALDNITFSEVYAEKNNSADTWAVQAHIALFSKGAEAAIPYYVKAILSDPGNRNAILDDLRSFYNRRLICSFTQQSSTQGCQRLSTEMGEIIRLLRLNDVDDDIASEFGIAPPPYDYSMETILGKSTYDEKNAFLALCRLLPLLEKESMLTLLELQTITNQILPLLRTQEAESGTMLELDIKQAYSNKYLEEARQNVQKTVLVQEEAQPLVELSESDRWSQDHLATNLVRLYILQLDNDYLTPEDLKTLVSKSNSFLLEYVGKNHTEYPYLSEQLHSRYSGVLSLEGKNLENIPYENSMPAIQETIVNLEKTGRQYAEHAKLYDQEITLLESIRQNLLARKLLLASDLTAKMELFEEGFNTLQHLQKQYPVETYYPQAIQELGNQYIDQAYLYLVSGALPLEEQLKTLAILDTLTSICGNANADAYFKQGMAWLYVGSTQLTEGSNLAETRHYLQKGSNILLDNYQNINDETYRESLVEALTNISTLSLIAGEYEQAIKEAEKALELKPSSKDAKIALANAYSMNNQTLKARNLYVSVAFEDKQYLLESIQAFEKDKIIVSYHKQIKRLLGNDKALLEEALADTENATVVFYKNQETALDNSIKLETTKPELDYAAIVDLLEQRLAYLEQLIEFETEAPTYTPILATELGNASYYAVFSGKYKEAIEWAQKAYKRNAGEWVRTNEAHAYLLNNQWGKAQSVYLDIKDKKNDVSVHARGTLGEACLEDLEALHKAHIKNPSIPLAASLLLGRPLTRQEEERYGKLP